jgi:hypothetical protein
MRQCRFAPEGGVCTLRWDRLSRLALTAAHRHEAGVWSTEIQTAQLERNQHSAGLTPASGLDR